MKNLQVENIPKSRLIPRRYSIDGLSFEVEHGEIILIVGGRAAGKDTLTDALFNNNYANSIEVADGYEIIKPSDSINFNEKQIIIKNGFFTRDQFHNNSNQLIDPDSPKHWELLEKAKNVSSTFIAIAEIDKLESDKIDKFSRIIVIDEGRIVADNKEPLCVDKLKEWIEEYAREKHNSLREDCNILIKKFNIHIENGDWLK